MKRTQKILIFIFIIIFQTAYFYGPLDAFLKYLKNKDVADINLPSAAVPTAQAANDTGMVVYGNAGGNIPATRSWDGAEFSSPGSAGAAVSTIQYVINEGAPNRTEHILGTSSSTGVTTFQVYNGSWGNSFSSTPGVGAKNGEYRGFDVAYEQLSGDGLVVYEDSSTANTNIKYKTWDGSSWSGERSLTVNSANVLWAKMEIKPLSNEIMLVTLDSLSDIYAYVWNGSSWGNAQLLTNSAAITTNNIFDVAYEYSSRDAMVVYGVGDTWNYWTYINNTWTNGTGGANCTTNGLFDSCFNVEGVISAINLSGSNENDYIGVAIGESSSDDFAAQMWDGSKWLAVPSIITIWDESGAVESNASEMPQDVTYEASGNRFMFAYTLNGLFAARYFFFDLDTNAWYNGNGTTPITDIDDVTTTTGNITISDLSWIEFYNNPDDTSQIMGTFSDTKGSVRSRLWDGSAWTVPTNANHGDAGTIPFGHPIGFVWDKTMQTLTVGSEGTQTSAMYVPSTEQDVGGAFSFIRNTGLSDNVTSIKLKETQATTDAYTELENVKLYYKQEATCSASKPAGTTLFNSSPGTFNASDEVTVTGTMPVGTSKVCVYVEIDVKSTAEEGDLIDIQIANPTTDVTYGAGVVPSSAVSIAGTTTIERPKLIVGDMGTQREEMGIPSADNWTGGAFAFVQTSFSTNVTSIKLKEANNVDAYNNFDNVVVWYKQEDTCSSESFPDGATQFNSTPGSFNASDEVTVTGTMAVGTSQICVYVKLDILDTTNEGDLMDIQITNPSTDVQVSSEIVFPATVVAIAGTTTLFGSSYNTYGAPFVYTQANWGTYGSGVNFFYEVYWRNIAGDVSTRVYDETAEAEVANSVICISSSDFVRSRTGALTLIDGHTYRAQMGHVMGASGEVFSARLVVGEHSAGADLAEFYSSEETLDLGEVVTVDSSKLASVKRSSTAYQQDILGVVSTEPGIILGQNIGQSYPIALVGRVPVKVSTENGIIRSGDRITSASVPGYGMRATMAGRVIGVALEDLDPEKLTACPVGNPSMLDRKCGTVMVFVNLADYSGMSVESLMAEMDSNNLTISDSNPLVLIESEDPFQDSNAAADINNQNSPFAQFTSQAKVLDFLKKLKENQTGYSGSDILTGNVNAINQIESPLIIADTLVAKHIKAESIEGLEFIQIGIVDAQSGVENNTSEVKNLGQQLADLQNAMQALTAKSGDLDVGTAKESAADGGLTIGGPAEFQGLAVFKVLAEFMDKVIFHNNVEFAGQVMFNEDSAGYAIIKKGSQNVAVSFSQEYPSPPVVNASLSLQHYKDSDVRAVAESLLLISDVKYIITNVTPKGFEIMMDRSADSDIPFSWQAVAVKNPQTFEKDTAENSPGTSTNVDASGSVSGATNSSPNPNAEIGGSSDMNADSTDSSVKSSAVSGASDSNTEFSASQPALFPSDATSPSVSPSSGQDVFPVDRANTVPKS